MATRVGIELSPLTCRIIEIDARSPSATAPETRVRSYAVLPAGGAEFRQTLTAFRRREAAVVVWGARSVHHQVFVPEHPYDQMREDALALARDAGAGTSGMLADIAPSGASQKGNRPVLLAMGSADELSLAVRPLLDAGVRVRSVTTPSGALTSLARVRREIAFPEAIEAYIALEERTTALALVRDGSLVAGRELAWGFLEDAAATSPRPRQEIATRLIEGIAELCTTIAVAPPSIGQMAICGSLPELRSLAALMTEQIDVEVEPLDSLFAIDAARLPEPSDEFRERSAELRLAWAVVADWPTPINFMRHLQRQEARGRLARAAVIAGVGMGLGVGWLIARDGWLQSTGRVTRVASSRPLAGVTQPQSQLETPPNRVPPAATPALPTTATPALPTTATPALPRPAAVPRATPLAPPLQPVAVAPVPLPPLSLRGQPPVPRPVPQPVAPVQPASVQPGPIVSPATLSPALPAADLPQSVPASRPPSPAPPPTPTIALARPQSPPARTRERSPAAPVPFNAVLGTILYSADRRLAIIDGRIVGVGEEVKGARVIEISPNVVTLRDSQGQLRTLTLTAAGP